MRYVVEKRNRNGASRWFWQRAGFNTKRLPVDEVDRLKAAAALNERADAEKRGEGSLAEPEFGSIAWAVDEYRKSPKFASKAAATRRAYERWMISLTETVQSTPPSQSLSIPSWQSTFGVSFAGGLPQSAGQLH